MQRYYLNNEGQIGVRRSNCSAEIKSWHVTFRVINKYNKSTKITCFGSYFEPSSDRYIKQVVRKIRLCDDRGKLISLSSLTYGW